MGWRRAAERLGCWGLVLLGLGCALLGALLALDVVVAARYTWPVYELVWASKSTLLARLLMLVWWSPLGWEVSWDNDEREAALAVLGGALALGLLPAAVHRLRRK